MRFQKGKSANPGGIPKGGKQLKPATIEDVLELAKTFSIEALQTIRSVMRNKQTSPGVRVTAAGKILERAWGAPVSYSAEEDRNRRELDAIPDSELIADLDRIRRARQHNGAAPAPRDPQVSH